MFVKIGNTIYDSHIQPIMIVLTPQEKEHIANMAENATQYCSAPDGMDEDVIRKFMEIRLEQMKNADNSVRQLQSVVCMLLQGRKAEIGDYLKVDHNGFLEPSDEPTNLRAKDSKDNTKGSKPIEIEVFLILDSM